MKLFLSLFGFALAFGLAVSDFMHNGDVKHPDYPNQCYIKDLEQAIAVNQTIYPTNRKGYCKSIFCRSDIVIGVYTCNRDSRDANDKCKFTEDFSLPYPSCCPKYVCQD